jgi:hypothetical protein
MKKHKNLPLKKDADCGLKSSVENKNNLLPILIVAIGSYTVSFPLIISNQ